ncbi:MAG TPA: DUF5060 domain-containing protein [Trueperaceae bacterium]
MSRGPGRRASLVEYAYAAALAVLAAAGALAPAPTPPEAAPWRGPFPVVRLGEGAPPAPPTVRVNETLDLEVAVPAPRGDPYDAVAEATFTNDATGDAYRVQAFYAGGESGRALYRFRFTPTSAGEWRFDTASEVPGLDGRSGAVTAAPAALAGPLVAGGGRFLLTTAAGDLAPTTYNVLSGPGGPLEDLGDLPRDEDRLAAVLEERVAAAARLGFDAVHVVVAHEWFSLGTRRSDLLGSVQPDPRTFRVLETLAAVAHRHGLFLHLWQWGDETRRLSPLGIPADPTVPGDPGGQGGAAFDRLQRYIAARLGPLPNWTMSYGVDLDEWSDEDAVRAWAARLGELLPLPHLLAAVEEGSGPRAFDLGDDKLALVSRDLEGDALVTDTFGTALAELARARGRPLLLEADLLVSSDGPWDEDGLRRGLWRLALAGGVGAVWGLNDEPVPDPEQLRTFARFWEGRLPAASASSRLPGGGLALVAEDGRSGVVYVEDAGAVPLDALPAGAGAFAVDAAAPYDELPVDTSAGAWTAPRRSDWAVAFTAP